MTRDINKIASADELMYPEEPLEAEAPAGEIRTIETVTAEIIMLKRGAEQIALHVAIELGRRLTEAKEMLPHGEWGTWLEERVSFSQDTAGRYMRLFREYADGQTSLFGAEVNSATLRNLSVSKALALLAVPAGERETFAEEHGVEDLSTREMRELMEKLKQSEQDKANAENAAESAAEELKGVKLDLEKTVRERDGLARQVKDLESRLVEVAVKEPDPEEMKLAIADAVQEATAELENEKKELRKALDQAAAKFEDKTDLEVERDALKKQVRDLEKQVAMSGADATKFSVLFDQSQRAVNEMMEGIRAVSDPKVRVKFCAAARKLFEVAGDKLDQIVGLIGGGA